ncbi:hypothetical protein [Haloechinothrix salitolerans]|uniref:Uncharacterized protein n=1 Tax=Haloechinothrix salitolerans TaxID=926830 RepID=A0ABW2BTK0_9PSEU
MTQEMDIPPSGNEAVRPTSEPPPGETPPGRAADAKKVPFIIAGAVLLLQALLTAGWQGYLWYDTGLSLTGVPDALLEPHENPVEFAVLNSTKAVFAVAMLVTALCLFARRRAARSAAVLFGALLLVEGVREASGVLSPAYEEWLPAELMPWLRASWAFGLVVAFALFGLMLWARENIDSPRLTRSTYRVGGVLLVVYALLSVIAFVVSPAADDVMVFLRMIADPRASGPTMLFGAPYFTSAFGIVAALVLGVLAMSRKRSVRGAVLVLMSTALYHGFAGLLFGLRGMPWSDADVALHLANLLLMPLLAAVILVLFAKDSDKRAMAARTGTTSDAPRGPALAGDLGEQHTSGD